MPLPVIEKNSIHHIVPIPRKPVYKVYLNDSDAPTLIVKGENRGLTYDDCGMSAVWSSKLMAHIHDPVARAKLLTNDEINHFKEAAKRMLNEEECNRIKEDLNWVKMSFVADLMDTDVYIKDNSHLNNVSIEKLLQVVVLFQQNQTWFDLGKVTAVDIFNGNNDRLWFRWENPNDLNQLEVFVGNPSNIMFAPRDDTVRIIGLDTFHAVGFNSGASDLSSENLSEWPVLRVLSDEYSKNRLSFAAKCVGAVGTELKNIAKNGRIDVLYLPSQFNIQFTIDCTKLDVMFDSKAHEFLKGLEAGISGLKDYLQKTLKKYKEPGFGSRSNRIPRGISQRINVLNWAVDGSTDRRGEAPVISTKEWGRRSGKVKDE